MPRDGDADHLLVALGDEALDVRAVRVASRAVVLRHVGQQVLVHVERFDELRHTLRVARAGATHAELTANNTTTDDALIETHLP